MFFKRNYTALSEETVESGVVSEIIGEQHGDGLLGIVGEELYQGGELGYSTEAEFGVGIGTEEVVVMEPLAYGKAVKFDVVLFLGDDVAFFTLEGIQRFGGDEIVGHAVGEFVLLTAVEINLIASGCIGSGAAEDIAVQQGIDSNSRQGMVEFVGDSTPEEHPFEGAGESVELVA